MFQAFRRTIASSLRYSSDLVLPAVCVACGGLITDHNLVCPACWTGIMRITPPLCDRLGIPMPAAEGPAPHVSVQGLTTAPQFHRARAACLYTGVIRRLIVRFKFEDRHEPMPLFLHLMRDAGRELLQDADVLVPVPLHRLRLLQRRFNQSALLAKGLAKSSEKPLALMALKRLRRTKAQVGLSQAEREENVNAAFAVTSNGKSRIQGRRVLLIDDVMTTGATANSCARTLKAAGAAYVDVLTIARTLPGYDNSLLDKDDKIST